MLDDWIPGVIGVEETDTLFGNILDLDGVGFAIEPEDWVAWRHCGGFTGHREERDGID